MRNIAAEPSTFPRAFPEPLCDGPPRRVQPAEVAEWLERRLPKLCERWLREVQGRYDAPSRVASGLLDEFLTMLAGFLPTMLGPHREQVEPLWVRASELFGEIAARRGLAAGEVIEEFQVLRELIIRLLYQDPPMGGRVPLSLRDVLRLNRAIDRGVTHASVGHTDALFFALFRGSGIPDAPPTSEFMSEMRAQLAGIRLELDEILGRVPAQVGAGSDDED